MKSKLPLLPFALAVIIACTAAGCRTADVSGISHRIQEKSDVFAKLTPEQQRTIQDGYIERGFTADMVYMVMGNPANVAKKQGPLGNLEMWTYHEFSRNAPTALDTRNNPGTQGYQSQTVATISADVKGEAPDAVKPAGLGARSAAMGPLNVADLQRSTVYLFFSNGRVAEIKLDVES